MTSLAISPPVADPLRAEAVVGEPSTDLKYLRHEFQTFAGQAHWSMGWTPPQAKEAAREHLRGVFWRSAELAIDVLTYSPILGAFRQRRAPALRTRWSVGEPGLGAPARFAQEDLQDAWTKLRHIYGEILRDVAMMGFCWVHQHLVVDDRGLEVPRFKRWPLQAVTWRPRSPAFAGGYYTSTVDSGYVRMVHGDGHWILFGNGERPHESEGAIQALGISYTAGELARRDRANLSAAAGTAAPYATLPEGIAPETSQGQQLQRVMAGLGSARVAAVVPSKTVLGTLQINTDTTYFKDSLADETTLIALALLGQNGTMTAGGGGVYTAPVFQGVLEALVDTDIEVIERGFNEGVAFPVTAVNYPDLARKDVPLLAGERPDDALRAKALAEIVKAQREAGLAPTQADVDGLAARLRTATIPISTVVKKPEIFAYHIDSKTVARDEARKALELPPLPGGIGSTEHLADVLEAEEAAAAAGEPVAP